MSELTTKQLAELNKNLLERKAELAKLLADVEDGSKPVSLDQPIGRLSRMDALQQQSMSQANRQVAVQRLEQVKSALLRIESGLYGICLGCEDDIDFARLQARPEAPFCIECQGERERKK